MGDERADIEAHADGDQKHADKQPLERLDRDLNLSAIFRAGQQQAADQGAKSHGQAGRGGGKPGTDHDQQARRDERFLDCGCAPRRGIAGAIQVGRARRWLRRRSSACDGRDAKACAAVA